MTLSRNKTLAAAAAATVGVVAMALFAQTNGSFSRRAGAQSAASVAATGAIPLRPQLTRLQVDLFELRCGPEELMRLDLMALGQTDAGPMKAAPEQILERLRQLGEARLAVRYDNFVDITSGTRLTSGTSVPTVREIATTGTGVIVPSIGYEQAGFVVELKGSWLEETETNLAFIEFDLESSELASRRMDVGGVSKEGRLSLPMFDRFQSSQRIVARQGLPVLLACNDLSKQAPAGEKIPVLVARVVATRLLE